MQKNKRQFRENKGKHIFKKNYSFVNINIKINQRRKPKMYCTTKTITR